MSQSGVLNRGVFPPGSVVQFLEGNSGGMVPPDGTNTIHVIGDTTTITVVGNPGTNTLTISTAGTVATQYDTDAGSAVPAAGILNVLGGHDINTAGAGNTVTIHLDNAITLGDLAPVVGDALDVVTGDISLDDGNLNLTNTDGTGTSGVIQFGGIRTISNFGTDNIFVGQLAGNTTVTGTDNSAFGDAALSGVGFDGSNVIAIGSSAAVNYTSTESSNIIIGNSGVALENNTIRIGTTGGGAAQQNNTYIAGIDGVNVGSVASVVSISGDHLGLTTITAGNGISVTPGANTVTIASSSPVIAPNYSVANASPYVVQADDYYITVDTSTIPITIQLPDAPTQYQIFVIKDSAGNASTNNVTVTTVSGLLNIDAATTFVMNTDWEAIQVLYDGFGYQVW